MNIKPESSKAYFPAQNYDTLDLKATLLSASSVQVYRARQRTRKFISISLSLSKMHADATFRADELFLRQKNYIKVSGGDSEDVLAARKFV
jgi:hypothetical protein